MPITPTYPGVYIEEIPSGVRTITGVSTSVTAFVGSAKRGPINKAVHILSYADFERNFGGLDANSEMSYAVRQFFLNGGSDAWVVRLAKNTDKAKKTLSNSSGKDCLNIEALDEGKAGNNIEVRVDYQTSNPASTFNLTLKYISPDNPTDSVTERFENLSMNSQDARYVEDIVNDTSQLVKVTRVPGLSELTAGFGNSTSGKLIDSDNTRLDVASLRDDRHNQFRVSVNGLPPVTVILTPTDVSGTDAAARLNALAAAIQNTVSTAASFTPELKNFTCTNSDNCLVLTSGGPGEESSVRVLPGERNDISTKLKLGTFNGGIETDAVAAIRPKVVPLPSTLTSGVFTSLTDLPNSTHTSFKISLDGNGPDTVKLDSVKANGDLLLSQLTDIAGRIQKAVRALKPAIPAYKGFTCEVVDNKLKLTSGTQGTGSSIVVDVAEANSIANELNFISGTTKTQGRNVMLEGGNDEPYKDDDSAYSVFIAQRSEYKGIYALEKVDLFNLLCLPGVTNSNILIDANLYCQERRAFLILDAPKAQSPYGMVDYAKSPELPKTEYGAVYYPWVYIADPLKNGKLRLCPPSGTIAGLYARTDSARGVWKAPAGTEANLIGVQAVAQKLTDPENGTLNPLGVNCIRLLPVFGAVAWGARTLRGADQMTSEYKYIPVRRLALYIEESLYRGTQWVVFEPNDEPLWAQIRLNLGAFMHNLFRQGAFQGKSPREAYFVKCDSETTTQNDINLGIVNIIVGFAPLKPAEFVIIQLQQMAGQIQA